MGKREGRHAQFPPVAAQFHHQFIGGWHNAQLVALAQDFQPPAFLPILVASTEKTTHLIVHDFRNTQPKVNNLLPPSTSGTRISGAAEIPYYI